MTIGERIRTERKKAGLTQKTLGEKCQMPDSQIRQYELSMVKPKIEQIQRIANALNVKLSDLVSMDWAVETVEENRIVRTYSAVDIAIKDNLDKMNDTAKKKVFDYTEDLLQNTKYQKDND